MHTEYEDLKSLIFASIVSLIVTITSGLIVIPILKRLRAGQTILHYVKEHENKNGTPTMGGLFFIVPVCIVFLFFGGYKGRIATVSLGIGLAYLIVGFLDDFIKIYKKRSLGLRAYQKIIGQFGIALIVAWYGYITLGGKVYVPFMNTVDFGIWYIPFAMFVILAIVNGVNLADGLDGLASRMTLVQGLALSVIILITGKMLNNPQEETLNLAILSASMAGACLGFLRFNTYPARIFMGDTGALMLGGCLAICAIYSQMALLLPIMCIMLVATCISVILQVGWFKISHGKRIFKMAPLHHHYELLGYHETTVCSMYTLITIVACVIAIIIVLI